jgi:hypothetical protein
MPKGTHRNHFFIHQSQQFMLDVCLAIADGNMLVALVSLDSTLNTYDLVFEEEFHTQQVFYIYLSLFYLNWHLRLFQSIDCLSRTILNVFMMLAFEPFINALKSKVLLALFSLSVKYDLNQFIFVIDFFNDLFAERLKVPVSNKCLFHFNMLLGVELPNRQGHILLHV